MKIELIIFDMDGTLVQSEDCSSQAMIDVIPALTDSVQEVTTTYRGVQLLKVFDDNQARFPGSIPDNCLELYRQRENHLAQTMVTRSAGVADMLSQLHINKCIASNAPVEKTRRSLEICGLSHFFETGVFSAYQVQAWKPDPQLFEYAAGQYGVDPARCLVVEDSAVGIQAADAAGMASVFYDPHNLAEDVPGVCRIQALSELLHVLT